MILSTRLYTTASSQTFRPFIRIKKHDLLLTTNKHHYGTFGKRLVCVGVHTTEIIMEQIEQQLLLLWRISNDKKYVHVTIPFLLCTTLVCGGEMTLIYYRKLRRHLTILLYPGLHWQVQRRPSVCAGVHVTDEQSPLLSWRISNDNKYVQVTIYFLLCVCVDRIQSG